MKHKVFAACLAAVLLAPLAACETAPPPQQNFADLSYRHLEPIHLAVADVTVETRYIPPLKPPHVEHRSPVTPYNALRQWGQDRIRAAGGELRARLVILDASIVETKLPVKGGVQGAFTREQAARYDGKLSAMLEIVDQAGRQRAFATARASRSQTAPEGATIAEREKLWFAMTEYMMRQINDELEENIRRHLGTYLRAG